MYAETDGDLPSATARRAAATCSSGNVIAIFFRVIPNIIPPYLPHDREWNPPALPQSRVGDADLMSAVSAWGQTILTGHGPGPCAWIPGGRPRRGPPGYWQTGVMAVLPGAGHPAPAPNDLTSDPRLLGPAREAGAATVREAGPAALPEPCVLVKVGEIVLKGGNRHHFERLLQQNIHRAVRDLGVGVQLWNRNGVMVLRLADQHGTSQHETRQPGTSQHGTSQHGPGSSGPAAEAAMDRVAGRVSSVMGIARVCRAARVAKDPEGE